MWLAWSPEIEKISQISKHHCICTEGLNWLMIHLSTQEIVIFSLFILASIEVNLILSQISDIAVSQVLFIGTFISPFVCSCYTRWWLCLCLHASFALWMYIYHDMNNSPLLVLDFNINSSIESQTPWALFLKAWQTGLTPTKLFEVLE